MYVIKISLRSLHFNITLIQLFINTLTFQRWWRWCNDEFYIFTAEVCTGKKSSWGQHQQWSADRMNEWFAINSHTHAHIYNNYIPLPILSRWIFYEMKLCTWSTEMNFMALITIYCFHFLLLLLFDGTRQTIFSRSWWWW